MLQRSPGSAVRYVKPIAPQWQRPSYDRWLTTFPSSPGASGLDGEQLDVRVLVRRSNHALESQPDLLEQPDRIRIRRRDDCDDPREPKHLMPIAPHGARGLVRVALRTILRQEGEADVDVREPFALDETAQADGCARLAQLRHVHAETERLVARDRTIDYVSLRVRQRAHATIPDVADEVRIVDELEYEMVISSRRMTQDQAFGRKHFRHPRLRRSVARSGFDSARPVIDGADVEERVETIVIGTASQVHPQLLEQARRTPVGSIGRGPHSRQPELVKCMLQHGAGAFPGKPLSAETVVETEHQLRLLHQLRRAQATESEQGGLPGQVHSPEPEPVLPEITLAHQQRLECLVAGDDPAVPQVAAHAGLLPERERRVAMRRRERSQFNPCGAQVQA